MSASPTFYLFHGDDELSIREALSKIRAQMGDGPNAEMNIDEYDGDDIPPIKALNDVSSLPFLADKRLVIVRGLVAHWMKRDKKALDHFIEQLPNLPKTARLVLVERESLRANLKIVKFADQHGFLRKFEVPKDSTRWIIARAQEEYAAVIEPAAAQALSSVTGGDLQRADHELFKLACYVDGERAITEADVALLTPYVPEANVFDMVDALANGDGKTAYRLMTQALEQDPRDPGFRLFALIVRQFRLLLLVREYLDSGGNSNKNAIAQALGIHPYPAGKLAAQSRRFTVPQLELIYRRLQQYDLDAKTGRVTMRMALELLVASLAKSA